MGEYHELYDASVKELRLNVPHNWVKANEARCNEESAATKLKPRKEDRETSSSDDSSGILSILASSSGSIKESSDEAE